MEHVKAQLSEYLDRELPAAEMRGIESHLSACPECRRELEELSAVSKLVQSLPKEPLPEGFMQRLERRRRAEESPKPARFLIPAPARAFAFALSSIVVMFVVYRTSERMSPSEEKRPTQAVPLAPAIPKSLSSRSAGNAPASTRGLAGAPLDETASAPKPVPYTNEMLQERLEAEKSRMGIRRILAKAARPAPPEAELVAFGSAGGAGPDGLGQSFAPLKMETPAPALPGNTPTLLAASGRQGTLTQAQPPGAVIRSSKEQAKVWEERSLAAPAPQLDYSRQMLVVVFPQNADSAVEIIGAITLHERVIMQYREVPIPPQTPPSAANYQFQILPTSDLPVSFQQLP